MPNSFDSPSAKDISARGAETRRAGFDADAHRQSLAVAATDREDEGLFEFMDAAWANLEDQ